MRHWDEPKREKARIEIIPMIDVMMFLLVFFVLISLNVIPALGIKTQLPRSSQSEELLAPVRAVVTLAKAGALELDGKPVALNSLPAMLHALEKPGHKLVVVLNGDDGVDLQHLIDVMDVVKGAGFESLSIAAKHK
ncbi:ExbD/TolR family protein [Niveibacterium terrae]|uniref:ExbD/TolR family protein n=1 Tax=Niveibacterium terrae TaxID=3373598 RepID=UPI003A92111D